MRNMLLKSHAPQIGCFLGQTTKPLEQWTVLGPYRGYVAPDVVHEHDERHEHVTWPALRQLALEEGLLEGKAGEDLILHEYRYRNVRGPSDAYSAEEEEDQLR